MKKIIFATVLAALVLSACGGTQPVTPAPTYTSALTATLPATRQVETPSPSAGIIIWPVTPTRLPTGRSSIISSSADSGAGSLRQALMDAHPGDIITFDPAVFPPSSPTTITLASALPEIKQGNLTIDASNAGVILDGSQVDGNGLSILSDHNTVRGLQLIGFSGAGIGLSSGAEYNLIGGDRNIGSGPLGQGNLLNGSGDFGIGLWDEGTSYNTIQGNIIGINLEGTETRGKSRDGIHSNGANYNLITGNVIGGNDSGVYLCCVADGRNTVTNNIVGTDLHGEKALGNNSAGILMDRTSYNIIGPNNLIAHNTGKGIMFWEDTPYNIVTRNSIHDNGEQGIDTGGPGNPRPAAPLIFDFALQAGSLSGAACSGCTVEIFSDGSDEGANYEGQAHADNNGAFTFNKGAAFTGSHVTSTATNPDGSTSEFLKPTAGEQRRLVLQEGNDLSKVQLQPKQSADLADNRTGASFYAPWLLENYANALGVIKDLGLKCIDTSYAEVEAPIQWDVPEQEISPEFDQFVDDLAENGVAIDYMLHYWNKAGHENGEKLSTLRFKSEGQIQDFLDYVRFIVRHFKGRVQFYTIWSEPDNAGQAIKYIEPNDYINLARQVIPVIRQEDPQAKVVLAPNVLYFAREYLFTVLSSDVMPLFDVVSWHGMYGAAPDTKFFGNYYYDYPSIIQQIMQTASEHGFKGEYWGTELTWCSEEFPACHPADQPWGVHADIQSAKYYARGIVGQLGMDVGVGLGGLQPDAVWSFPTIRNINTIMAGAEPTSLTVDIQRDAANMMSYSFTLPNGDELFALWTDGIAVDDDPGVKTTLVFPSLTVRKVMGIDVLNGFEQELIAESGNDGLVIRNLVVKDYPIILRFMH
jgi:hypothetical protein